MRVAAGQRRRALVGQTAGEENPLAAPRAEGKDSTAFDEGEGQKAEEFDKVGDQEVAGSPAIRLRASPGLEPTLRMPPS